MKNGRLEYYVQIDNVSMWYDHKLKKFVDINDTIGVFSNHFHSRSIAGVRKMIRRHPIGMTFDIVVLRYSNKHKGWYTEKQYRLTRT
jgi:hypothetical protein